MGRLNAGELNDEPREGEFRHARWADAKASLMTPAGAVSARFVAAKVLLGAVLAVHPAPLLRRVAGTGPAAPGWLARLLGGRVMVQSAVELARPTRTVLLVSATVDAAHALSMVPFTAAGAYRRTALISGAVAAATAALSVRAACRVPIGPAGRPPPAPTLSQAPRGDRTSSAASRLEAPQRR